MTMFSQDQVNQWFAANPNATPEFVAQTVQQAGGLDAHQGLAGLIGQHYGTDANTITSNYNTLVNPATPATPVDYSALVNNAYSGIGRTGVGTDVKNIDQEGLDYWTGQLKSGALTPENFNSAFNNAVYTYAAANPTDKYTQYVQDYQTSNPTTNQYFVNNPDVAAEYARNSQGMTPEQFATTHYNKFGVNENRLDPNALSGVAGLYQTYLGRTPESRSALDSWAKQFGSTIEPEEIAAFRQAAAPELKNTGYLSDPFKNEVKDYVSGVLADTSLGDWEKVNKVLEQAQKSGVTQAQLESIYGKDATQPYLDTYKKGITDYIDKTLATDPAKTTFDEVGQIHNAFAKYGLTPDEVAKYGGLDPKQVQTYFDQYNQGLGTIISQLSDPKVDELTRTQTALALANKYGTTDAELAKASKGKYTEKDVAAYLDPVRNVPTNLQKLFDDPNATAKDILKVITDAKADPRAAGIYGAALDKMAASAPELYLRDASNGKADISDSYEGFLTAAKATPEMATKYADQIKAVEQAKSIIGKHALRKDFGGEYRDYAMQMFLGLDKDAVKQAPKQLEMTAPTTKKATAMDPESGGEYTYDVTVPAALKPGQKGIEPVWSGETWGDGTYAPAEITGYRKKVDADDFSRQPVYATYDTKGNLTGYESDARVHTADRTYYGAKWKADGSPAPYGVTKSRGGFGGFIDDIMSDPIMGPLATIAAATYGGPAGVAALQAAQGASLEDIGKSMALAYIGGQVGGQVTNAVGGAEGALGAVGSQAAGQFAGNAATGILSGKDLDFGNMALSSLINAGVDVGGNKLLGESGIATLGSASPYAKAITSNVLSSAISGQNPDLAKTVTNTAVKEAMKSGKEQLKTAKAP